MLKYQELTDKLAMCYVKIPYKFYFFSSQEIQDQTCLKEREDLIEYLNSDSMNFENIIKERIKCLEENETRVTGGNYKIPDKADLSYYIDF